MALIYASALISKDIIQNENHYIYALFQNFIIPSIPKIFNINNNKDSLN